MPRNLRFGIDPPNQLNGRGLCGEGQINERERGLCNRAAGAGEAKHFINSIAKLFVQKAFLENKTQTG